MIRVNGTIDDILEFERLDEMPMDFILLINDAFEQFKNTKATMEDDLEYYRGERPFNNDNYYITVDFTDGGNIDFTKIAKQNINYAKFIVDQETSLFVGKSPAITTATNKVGEINRINEFNRQLSYRNWKEHLTEAIRNKSKMGRGYLLVHNKEGDIFPRFSELNPMNAFVAYDQYIDPDSLFGCYVVAVGKEEYLFHIYTQNYVYIFNSITKDKMLVPNGEVVKRPHSFGRVPINEFRNNGEEQSSIEPVKGLISLICAIQNDIVRGNHEAVKSLLHIDGVKIGTTEEQERFLDLFAKKGMIITEGEAQVKLLNNSINQNEAQNTKKQALQDLWSISRTANFSDPEFAQSASEPALKLKLKGVLDKALDSEKTATPTIKRIMKCVLSYVEQENFELYKKIKFDINRMTIKYFHPLPSSDLATSTILMNMYNMGTFNPILLSEYTFMPEDIETYMEGVVKKPEYQEMKESQGNNETNRERQASVIESIEQKDNFENFAQGKAQDL